MSTFKLKKFKTKRLLTVGDLKQYLSTVDNSVRIVTNGYEGDFDDIIAYGSIKLSMYRNKAYDWMGEHKEISVATLEPDEIIMLCLCLGRKVD